MGIDLSRRSQEDELMDDPDVSFEEFQGCLGELAWINLVTLGYRPTLKWLGQFRNEKNLRLLDAGSGGGDMLRVLARQGYSFVLQGADLNPLAARYALSQTTDGQCVEYKTADIFSLDRESKIDLIISSLFTHHLSDEQIVTFLQWMHRTARRGWFINDLHRHILPYHFIKYATRFFSKSRLIRNDGAVSVARAFTLADWRRLLEEAGIPRRGVKIIWHFPFRICVSYRKF